MNKLKHKKITYSHIGITVDVLAPENASITDILFLADLELQHQTSPFRQLFKRDDYEKMCQKSKEEALQLVIDRNNQQL